MDPITSGAEAKDYTSEQVQALNRVSDEVHRLNGAIIGAVEAGLTVELRRASRHHSAAGHWGDQSVPVVS